MDTPESIRFDQLNLSPQIMRALQKKGYEYTTPVQAGTIPPMLAWRDVIAKAPTGTGKTYAFGIPMVEHIDLQQQTLQGLILAPTRELALQIGEEMRDLCAFKQGVKVVVIYGGQPIGRQIDLLKKRPQIVVATPGRLMDHFKRRTIQLNTVQTVVLDECDRMLDMGFVRDVTRILDLMPKRRNLALLSATISREVMNIAWVYQRDAAEVTVQADEENKPDILQFRLKVSGNAKVDAVAQILESGGFERAIAFCNTKNMVERLNKMLEMRGICTDYIHGDIKQINRERVIARFREGKLRVLIATDVAARGLDIYDVDTIINYDVPDENEYYIHRIGRTGRAKKHGTAYTLVAHIGDEIRLNEIAKHTRSDIVPVTLNADGKLVLAGGK